MNLKKKKKSKTKPKTKIKREANMAINENEKKEIKVGTKVTTADGDGVVMEVGDRYYTLKLANGTIAKFSDRDATVIAVEKK